MPATTDPNWLLSTTAQSAAALVAIVGGFLVSRLVALSTERQSLQRRLDELQRRHQIKREQGQDVYEERHAYSAGSFKEAMLERYIHTDGELAAEAAVREFFPIGATHDEMIEVAEEFAATVRSMIEAYRSVGSHLPAKVREAGYVVDEDGERVLKWYADLEEHNRLAFVDGGRSPLDDPDTDPSADRMLDRQERRIELEAQLSAEVLGLEAEANVVRDQLLSLARPAGARPAVLVLGYFSVVGILVPLWGLSRRPVWDGPTSRLAVVLLFVSGLVALLGYVWWFMGQLRWRPTTGSPPEPTSSEVSAQSEERPSGPAAPGQPAAVADPPTVGSA